MDLLEDPVRKAIQRGADYAETFLQRKRRVFVKEEKGAVKRAVSTEYLGVGLRVIVGKRMGFAHALNPKSVDDLVSLALDVAKSSPPDEDLNGLPSPKPVSYLSLMDPRIRDLSVDEAVELTLAASEAARKFNMIYSTSSELEAYYEEVSVFNSEGVNVSEPRTSYELSIRVSAKEGDSTGAGLDFSASRFLSDLKPEELGERAAKIAMSSMSYELIGVEELPIILSPKAQIIMVPFLVGSAANSENIQYKRSFLSDKVGEMIADERVSVVDYGRSYPKGSSKSFDGEGLPTQDLKVVDRGVFVTPIYNHYTAGKDGRESTGNASRGSYDELPGVGAHVVRIEAPDLETEEEEVMDVKRGVYVYTTFDRPNLATGEFSGLAETAFLVENGEIRSSLRQTNVAFHLLDLLRPEALGKDVEVYGPFAGGSLRIRGKVAGPK